MIIFLESLKGGVKVFNQKSSMMFKQLKKTSRLFITKPEETNQDGSHQSID